MWVTARVIIVLTNISYYSISITIHGILMIFYMVMPMFINGLGNILIIICIGNSDVSYPRCNNISVIIYIITYKFIISSILMEYNNGVGWTIYPPLASSLITISSIEIYSIINSLIGLGISSSYTFINNIVTVVNNKVQCYNYNILIVYIHSLLIVSILLCLVLPVLTITLIMLILDIYSNSMYYDIIFGGDSIFYQHLFWFFGHPEVYILIIPSFGVINYCINSIVYKLYSKLSIIISILVISIIGLIVWCHHMYIVGLDNDTKAYFTCISLIISIPTGCKIYNWLITLISTYSNIIIYNWLVIIPYMLWIYYLVLFIIGGTTGIIIGNIIIDMSLHDTFYIIIHFHIVLSLSIIISIFIILLSIYWELVYYYIYIVCLVSNNLIISRYCISWILFSIYCIFVSMYLIGYNIMTRRIVDYNKYINSWNVICCIGNIIIVIVISI